MAENDVMDLPYGSEYAKSSRARCVQCKNTIQKDELRLSVRVRSQNWDGIQDLWHHETCFWKKKRDKLTEASIRGFEFLRWEDQDKIRNKINPTSSGTKRSASNDENNEKTQSSLFCECAKSGKSKCFDCKETIKMSGIRIKYKSKFYHPECLAKMGIFEGPANAIEGYEALKEEDQAELQKLFVVQDDGPSSAKKARIGDDPERLEMLKVGLYNDYI